MLWMHCSLYRSQEEMILNAIHWAVRLIGRCRRCRQDSRAAIQETPKQSPSSRQDRIRRRSTSCEHRNRLIYTSSRAMDRIHSKYYYYLRLQLFFFCRPAEFLNKNSVTDNHAQALKKKHLFVASASFNLMSAIDEMVECRRTFRRFTSNVKIL